MGFTFIASAKGNNTASGTTIDCTSTLNVQAGDLLVAFVSNWNNPGTVTVGQTDGSTNMMTQLSVYNPITYSRICYRIAATASATATFRYITTNATTYRDIIVMQFRPSGTVVFDVGPSANGDYSTSVASGTISTTGGDELIIGALSSDWLAGAVSSVLIGGTAPAGSDYIADENYLWYRTVSSVQTTIGVTATIASASSWQADICAFKICNKTVTVRPSGGTYTSLQSAITGEVTANADLTAAGMNGILTISIEGTWSSADTTAVNVTGFTTDSTHYVNIVTDAANRAGSAWDDGKYRLVVNDSESLSINANYTRYNGLQLNTTGNGNTIIIFSDGVVLDGVIAKRADGYRNFYNFGASVKLINCIAIGATRSFETGSAYSYNSVGVGSSGAGFYGTGGVQKNCYISSGGVCYGGTTLTTCASSDTSGSAGLQSIAYSTSNFTNVTAGSEDLSLKSGSALIGVGTDLSADGTYPFDYDIMGNARGATWDIGPVKYTGAGQTYTFVGWNTQADGSGTFYVPASTFTITNNTSLYAQWTLECSINETITSLDSSSISTGGITSNINEAISASSSDSATLKYLNSVNESITTNNSDIILIATIQNETGSSTDTPSYISKLSGIINETTTTNTTETTLNSTTINETSASSEFSTGINTGAIVGVVNETATTTNSDSITLYSLNTINEIFNSSSTDTILTATIHNELISSTDSNYYSYSSPNIVNETIFAINSDITLTQTSLNETLSSNNSDITQVRTIINETITSINSDITLISTLINESTINLTDSSSYSSLLSSIINESSTSNHSDTTFIVTIINENISSSDSSIILGSDQRVANETATITDSNSTILYSLNIINEGITASNSEITLLSPIINEAISVTDSNSLLSRLVGNINETANIDNSDVTQTRTIINETITSSDTSTSSILSYSDVNETGTTSSSDLTLRNQVCIVNETINTGNSDSIRILTFLNEDVTSTDIAGYTSKLSNIINETVSISEISSYLGGNSTLINEDAIASNSDITLIQTGINESLSSSNYDTTVNQSRINESISSTDTQSYTSPTSGIVNETITAVSLDTTLIRTTLNEDISSNNSDSTLLQTKINETGSVNESNTIQFQLQVNESSVSSDTSSSLSKVISLVNETATITTSETNRITTKINETITSIDRPRLGDQYDVNEPVNSNDSNSLVFSAVGRVIETSTITDTIAAPILVTATVNESITATASDLIKRTSNREVAETITAVESGISNIKAKSYVVEDGIVTGNGEAFNCRYNVRTTETNTAYDFYASAVRNVKILNDTEGITSYILAGYVLPKHTSDVAKFSDLPLTTAIKRGAGFKDTSGITDEIYLQKTSGITVNSKIYVISDHARYRDGYDTRLVKGKSILIKPTRPRRVNITDTSNITDSKTAISTTVLNPRVINVEIMTNSGYRG